MHLEQTGYVLSNPDKRLETYKEFMVNALCEYQAQTYQQAMEQFQNQKQKYEDSLCKALERAEAFLRYGISSEAKGKLRYIHFSYLLSGALSGEHLVKVDFYDKRHYKDTEETECFWNCRELFPQYDEECRRLEENMKKAVVRVKSRELSQIRIGLTACDYLILKPILTELVKGEHFLGRIQPYCDSTAYMLYGGYLDESEVLHQIQGV